MTKLEQQICNELIYTRSNETHEQKAKRIAESLMPFFEACFNEATLNADYELSFEDYKSLLISK